MKNKYQTDYELLKASGMFWEICAGLSGEWEKDKEEFIALRKLHRKVGKKLNIT
jgi:hypothetical protein